MAAVYLVTDIFIYMVSIVIPSLIELDVLSIK